MCGRTAMPYEADDAYASFEEMFVAPLNNGGGADTPDGAAGGRLATNEDGAGGGNTGQAEDGAASRSNAEASTSASASKDATKGAAQGSSSTATPGKAVLRWRDNKINERWFPRYNVAPQTFCLIVYQDHAASAASGSAVYVMDLAKWGLIPSWTKRRPETPMKTINCRDDTLFSGSGMWNSIRGRKRCLVINLGFYEWLTKGKDKLPYLTRMPEKDGKDPMMVMAGLYDDVKFEDADESLRTFTIITTASNKQLNFLHDRMPALLSTTEAIQTWLADSPWSPAVQKLIKPFDGPLTCYQVPKEVGKVGTESPEFIKPLAERKGNIMSLFASAAAKSSPEKHAATNAKSPPASPSGSSSTKAKRSPARSQSAKQEEVKEDQKRKEPESSPGFEIDEAASAPAKKAKVAAAASSSTTKGKRKAREKPPKAKKVDEDGNAKLEGFFTKK